ncbi:heptaprenyl diphosphate synthase component 1 [Paenibacillus sp. 481]|uniref:heptaprenyl diphosphate synthase component 1 n=1 Tax=Paenibacillus sp. 481 TaxID=2835869 RepID=UPI001E38D76F|nr:heptaprenyl diphosphate synthase component 1 [Paenibacillus sp. 481]UHA72958.1 heptaprenyl diphosphate synthase component 1 [Paenibacillus sp. 481]
MNGYRIPQLAQKYVEHDMIQAHTALPVYPDARGELLFAFLNRNAQTAEHSELYTLVTTLVQNGLDTHDTVEMASAKGHDRNMRSRQLKVLAGDYFSSRFYHLLAQAGQIDVIRVLSKAVCEVNRMKMTMMEQMNRLFMSADQYIHSRTAIHKELFRSFHARLNGSDAEMLESLLHCVTELEIVEQERQRAHSFEQFEHSLSYWMVWQLGTDEERQMLKERSYDSSTWETWQQKYKLEQQIAVLVRAAEDRLQTQFARTASTLSWDKQVATRFHSLLTGGNNATAMM